MPSFPPSHSHSYSGLLLLAEPLCCSQSYRLFICGRDCMGLTHSGRTAGPHCDVQCTYADKRPPTTYAAGNVTLLLWPLSPSLPLSISFSVHLACQSQSVEFISALSLRRTQLAKVLRLRSDPFPSRKTIFRLALNWQMQGVKTLKRILEI